MVKPKVINEVPVLIHAIIVRSYAARVRSKASRVETSSGGALCEVCSAICVGLPLSSGSSLKLMVLPTGCSSLSRAKLRRQNLRADQQHPDWKDQRDPPPVSDHHQQHRGTRIARQCQ